MIELVTEDYALIEAAASAPMLEQVEAWASVNTGTTNLAGLKAIAGTLADAFSTLPGDVALRDATPVQSVSTTGDVQTIQRGQNLLISVRPDAPVQILLTGHMDTVFGADHPFQSLKWLEEGVLNGPGTADMKGGISVMLAALKAVECSPHAANIGYDIILNSDEETGSQGSAALIAERAAGKLAAFTYEPALPDGTLAGARPGSGNFSITLKGKAAHAGRNPEEGRNALIAAADLAMRLNSAKTDGLKVNVARIDGGGPHNIVPDLAIVRVNMRPTAEADMDHARRFLSEAVDAVKCDHDVGACVHGGFDRPPKPLDTKAERLYNLVKECGAALDLPIAWKATGGVCDGNNIAACGIPIVDTMGPRGGAIHSSDEFLVVESLAERAKLSALAIARLASGVAL